ncbi:hypothetical protein ACFYU5_19315 [Nocardia aobensis]|uniref:Uncharacterized protein n=1 Tax=Nocardia aobensis TaxID=257277 RepID=A0ABW6P5Y2_9NOCA
MNISDIEDQMFEAFEYLIATFIFEGNSAETQRLDSALEDANTAWLEALMQER